MSILLIAFICLLILGVAAVWIAIRAIAIAFNGVAWTLDAALGGKRRRRHQAAWDALDRCRNDRCNATLRADARFCHRCGEPRHANRPVLAGPRAA